MSNQIDRIIYINLDSREDRRSEIESVLHNYSLTDRSERFSAIYRAPPMGIAGCGYSHLAVLKLAKERKYKRVFILEDDFVFTVSGKVLEQKLQTLFDSKETTFDVFMLSYNLIQWRSIPDQADYIRILSAETASGYIVSEHYYDTLIQLYETNIPLLEQTGSHWIYANDQIWKELQKRDTWLGFALPIGKQRASFSDNSQCFRDTGF
jgi:GR25 family glycosyltransferase involved in LPS biosynthesis